MNNVAAMGNSNGIVSVNVIVLPVNRGVKNYIVKETEMTFTLPELTYGKKDLEPHISARTLEFHYGKHHQGYVTKLNTLLQGTDLLGETLDSIVTRTVGDSERSGIFNNAAQVWNHTFYWQSMLPGGGGAPVGFIAKKIAMDFGGYEKFAEQFKQAALAQFGSGWIWLVLKADKLSIVKTSNADTPIARGEKPLLTIDVWEHAYYLDYQNRRGDYVEAFLKNLINWKFVNSRIA
jgi:superoxide dismutase, Fe-Mn family